MIYSLNSLYIYLNKKHQYYLTILFFSSVDSVDCRSDTFIVLAGLDDKNKPANHPPSFSLVSDEPLQHTAQIFHFIFIKYIKREQK